MKRLAVLVTALALTAGCQWIPGTGQARESAAKKAVASALRDPSSAQFRDIHVTSGYVCGEVNGRNGFGAYAGFKRFFVNKDGAPFVEPGDDAGGAEARAYFDLVWMSGCSAS